MTRAQGPPARIGYRSLGPAGAARTVLVVRTGALAMTDPAPHVTAEHGCRLLLVEVEGPQLDDPPAFGGETPAGSTAAEVLALLDEEVPEGSLGLVGERAAALFAVALAAVLGRRVDRLALVGVPLVDDALARDLLTETLGQVSAPSVVFTGAGDAASPTRAADWCADRLPLGRVEVVRDEETAPDGRLALSDVWDRVLGHVGASERRA